MIVTEKEAAEKWCPHARYALDRGTTANRWKQDAPPEEPHALDPIPCRCIGPRCMAWRQETNQVVVNRITGASRKVAAGGSYDDREWFPGWLEPTGRGYCGLAGKP